MFSVSNADWMKNFEKVTVKSEMQRCVFISASAINRIKNIKQLSLIHVVVDF